MPTGSNLRDIFGNAITETPECVLRAVHYMGVPPVALPAFTITNTGNSAAQGNVGGRPCLTLTNGGSSATTDLSNYYWSANTVIPQPGKILRIKGSWRASTITTDQIFGIGVGGAAMYGTPPTNFLAIKKASAATQFSFNCRKASGTAETFTLNTPAIVADTWYDFAIYALQASGATAGTGRVEIFWGASLNGGQGMTMVGQFDVATQFPDTVAQALFFSQRAGAVDSGTTNIGILGIEVASVLNG